MGAGPDDIVCGMVGRLVWEKGYRELFAAALALGRSGSRVRVVVIGPEDPARPDAVDGASITAAKDSGVRFLGMRDDVEDLYRAMDVFVLPSHREGFPRSAMEAAASGLPLILSDIRGCREVVIAERNGVLVPPGDAPSLAAAITRLVEDEALRARLGAGSLQRAASHFDQQVVIDKTLEVYERLLHGRPRRSATFRR